MLEALRWRVLAGCAWAMLCAAAQADTRAHDALLERGAYLAIAGDCVACHTAPDGQPFAGGLALATPLGEIVSTNITPSRTHGIGGYTFEQFSAALRRGIRADGVYLYPAMPYPSYARVTDEDTRALYAYFMERVRAVDQAAPRTSLPFPFSVRQTLAVWNLLFLDEQPYVADTSRSAAWNRGAYLVRGLAHCGACHTPRNAWLAESSSRALAGGSAGAWHAPNITPDVNSGIGAWSEAELIGYLRDGYARGKAHAAGPMAEAVDNSLRHLAAEDLRAVAVYLKTVEAVRTEADTQPASTWGKPANGLGDLRGVAWPVDSGRLSGAQLYDGYCASCHQASGEGASGGRLPSLFHSTTLGRSNTDNLVLVMLGGTRHPERTSDASMPGFAALLTDQQIATLGNHLLGLYGNVEAKVSVAQVARLRTGTQPSPLAGLARAAGAIAVLLLVSLIVLLAVRRTHRGAKQ
ncbi:cytochrome c [Caballeronia sp. LZ033]|nr:cytochrome c [Caballeronia sp. LZ033]MDR5818042.1 cytochrome c [Caballeronia sp. LZ033]